MTPTISPLPIEGSPDPGESLMGFVLRMSHENHMNGIQWLRSVMQKARIFHLSRQHVPTIAWVFGATIESFESSTVSQILNPTNSHWDFYSHYISRSYLIRHRTPQLCPRCIEEFGHIKKIWDLRAVTTCPNHQILLVDLCNGCNKPISWNRHSIFICRCKFDFRFSRTEQLPEEDIRIADDLEFKLEHATLPFSSSNRTTPSILLNPLSIDGTARVIHATGFLESPSDILKVGESRKEIRTKEMHQITKRSMERLSRLIHDENPRKTCSAFLTSSLLELENDGFTQNDRDLAHRILLLGRKGLPTRASLLSRNPRSQLNLF